MGAAVNYDTFAAGYFSGALYSTASSGLDYGVGRPTYKWSNEVLDLSRSNSIYGKSNTVTPLSRKCLLLIKY